MPDNFIHNVESKRRVGGIAAIVKNETQLKGRKYLIMIKAKLRMEAMKFYW